MSTITVSLPDDDLAFLRTLSKAQGTSAEELLARQAHNLRRRMERELPTAVVAATGVISGELDGNRAWLDHVEYKHR